MLVASIDNQGINNNQSLQTLSDISTITLNLNLQFGTKDKDMCLHYLESSKRLCHVLFQWAEDRFPCLHNKDEYDSMARLCPGMCGIFCKKYVMYLYYVLSETIKEHVLGGVKGRTRYNLAVLADTRELGFERSIHTKLWHLLATNYFSFVCPKRSVEELYHFLHAVTHSDMHITVQEDISQETMDKIAKEDDFCWFLNEHVTIKQNTRIDHNRFSGMKFSKQLLRHYSIDEPCICRVDYPRRDWESRRDLCNSLIVSKIEVPYSLGTAHRS